MSQYIVSARKYRPDSFGTLIGQDNIAQTLKNSILRGQLAHAYLFCGPRGVGKTTTARIFAKMINCSDPSSEMESVSHVFHSLKDVHIAFMNSMLRQTTEWRISRP